MILFNVENFLTFYVSISLIIRESFFIIESRLLIAESLRKQTIIGGHMVLVVVD